MSVFPPMGINTDHRYVSRDHALVIQPGSPKIQNPGPVLLKNSRECCWILDHLQENRFSLVLGTRLRLKRRTRNNGLLERILPRGSLLRMSNPSWLEYTGYSPNLMTKSRNKGQTVGEKYSSIRFLRTPGRILTSGSPSVNVPDPR